ncbi:MAG: hypothetical protein ACJ79R_01340 [Anaeromyxobacteraceae bacterium]
MTASLRLGAIAAAVLLLLGGRAEAKDRGARTAEPEEPQLDPPAQGPRETPREAQPAPARGAREPEDDEDLAARALQRSLVQRGALLLPVWGLEIIPALSYGHTSADAAATVSTASGTLVTLALRRRSHQLTGLLTSRLGLPWDLQVEASVPVLRAWTDGLLGGLRNDAFGSGLGDPRFSLTRQLLRARGAWPDLLVTGTWKAQVGSSPFDAGQGQLGVGTGYDAIGATLTGSKASDPLVFLASASYTANLGVNTNQGRRKPGDTWGLGAGAILAVSPETSMSFLLDFHYKPEDRLRGSAALGTDETVAVLQLGLATVASRRALLNFTVGIGLTADSPDFQLGVSLPLRF